MFYPNECHLCLSLLFLLLSLIPSLKKASLSAAVLYLQLLSTSSFPRSSCTLSSMPARELCSRRVTTVEGGQFYSKSCQYIVFCLCLSGPQPILVWVCLLHVIAIFMIPCLALNTSYTWKCSRIHGFSPSNLSAMIWPQLLVALGTGHQKDPLHLRFLQLFLQSGCG